MKRTRLVVLATLLCAGQAIAGSPLRVPVRFAHTNDAGIGYEWYVVGTHPDVGAWNPTKAVKLLWSEGDIWWGDIGVQAGTALQYKFVKRLTAPDQACEVTNAIWWPDPGDNLQVQVPAEPPAPFVGKQIEFYPT
jgi:hypothetical protein